MRGMLKQKLNSRLPLFHALLPATKPVREQAVVVKKKKGSKLLVPGSGKDDGVD